MFAKKVMTENEILSKEMTCKHWYSEIIYKDELISKQLAYYFKKKANNNTLPKDTAILLLKSLGYEQKREAIYEKHIK